MKMRCNKRWSNVSNNCFGERRDTVVRFEKTSVMRLVIDGHM